MREQRIVDIAPMLPVDPEQIRSRRLRLGWSQAELGRRAGMTQQAVHQLEKGISRSSRYAAPVMAALDRGEAGKPPLPPAPVETAPALAATLAGSAPPVPSRPRRRAVTVAPLGDGWVLLARFEDYDQAVAAQELLRHAV